MALSTTHADDQSKYIESDWLLSKVGSTGKTLGVNVTGIASEPDDPSTILDITVPIDNLSKIETVEVIGKKTLKPIKQNRKVEFLKNEDNETYGVRVYLDRPKGFEFQLRFIENNSD